MALATIQQIKKITPIENADAIETAHVLGWEVVVKKGEFKEGDICIYIEIDSLIPRKPWSEFLFNHPPKNTIEQQGVDKKEINLEYHRLRTVKLRGQISQGLVLSIDTIYTDLVPDLTIKDDNPGYIGEDVTDILEIKKYEKPVPQLNPRSGMQAKGNFPEFLHKTDEVRIQSKPELLEKLKDQPYYITIKMDGTSATFYKYKGKFGVCSRNLEIKNPLEKTLRERVQSLFNKIFRRKFRDGTKRFDLDIYWKMAYKYKIMDWLPEGYAIQGEICGPNIQGNKMGLKENELFIFNLFDIKKQKYLDLFDSSFLDDASVGDVYKNEPIKYVPPLGGDNKFNLSLGELLYNANLARYENNTPAEGIVVRSLDQEISFKVVSNKFLLKYGE